jgi:hypothetical protein
VSTLARDFSARASINMSSTLWFAEKKFYAALVSWDAVELYACMQMKLVVSKTAALPWD